jgi:uncharacterized spore protein YtfJ
MANDDQTTSEAIASQIGDALTGLFGEASPSTLFSEPIQHGDDLVVTAVAWERAGGFGFGAGQGQSGADEIGTGEGGGGGGFSQGRPVAVIKVSPTGVEVTPVIDFTKIGVTVLLASLGVWRALSR